MQRLILRRITLQSFHKRAHHCAIRQRAAELCETYRAQGCEKAAANAIRRAVRLTTGTNSVRELPRCEYSVAMEQVRMWDDRKTMKALRAKVNKQEATL